MLVTGGQTFKLTKAETSNTLLLVPPEGAHSGGGGGSSSSGNGLGNGNVNEDENDRSGSADGGGSRKSRRSGGREWSGDGANGEGGFEAVAAVGFQFEVGAGNGSVAQIVACGVVLDVAPADVCTHRPYVFEPLEGKIAADVTFWVFFTSDRRRRRRAWPFLACRYEGTQRKRERQKESPRHRLTVENTELLASHLLGISNTSWRCPARLVYSDCPADGWSTPWRQACRSLSEATIPCNGRYLEIGRGPCILTTNPLPPLSKNDQQVSKKTPSLEQIRVILEGCMYRGKGEEAAADRERLEKCSLAELQVCVHYCPAALVYAGPETCSLTKEYRYPKLDSNTLA